MRNGWWVALSIGLLASVGAFASDDLSYSFAEARWLSEDIDKGPDGDGFELGVSAEVGQLVHVFAGYADVEFDTFAGVDADATGWTAGVGVHKDVSEKASVFGEVGYVDAELESNVDDVSDDGFSAAVGIRGLVGGTIELEAGATYVDLSDAGDDTELHAGVLFNIGNRVGLGAEYVWSDESDSFSAGVRVYFGE